MKQEIALRKKPRDEAELLIVFKLKKRGKLERKFFRKKRKARCEGDETALIRSAQPVGHVRERKLKAQKVKRDVCDFLDLWLS